ncbi:LacI family transcriptional regulator [Humibacter sp. BT305]|nr:LacI family transcriptional regulator [Humibacter sp. BT305]
MNEGRQARRATLADVAARARVSRSTASLAFSGAGPVSEETRSRVLAAAAELDYGGPDPRARSLRQGRSGVVGVVFDERLLQAFRDPVNIGTLDGIVEGLGVDSNGILLLTETGATSESVRSAVVDAAVIMGCSPHLGTIIESLRRRGIPVVSIEGDEEDGVVDIGLDNAGAAEELARHLAELGHRRVATVTLATDEKRASGPLTPEAERAITTVVTGERLAGMRHVFPDAAAYACADSFVEGGAAAARVLLDVPADRRPTAIMAQSDLLAVGVLQAADELGIAVPQELSVTGFDGVRIDGLTRHDLTTMVQPVAEKGRAAGEAVVALLAGDEVSSRRYPCVFHAGTTTAPPPV